MKRIGFWMIFALTCALTGAAPQAAFADGNVLAHLELGDFGFSTHLVIVGDVKGNAIRVTIVDTHHAVIEGLDGTTVNGQSTVELSSDDVQIESVSIELGNGDDSLEYVCETWIYSAAISSGNGSDSVSLAQHRPMGSISVDTGVGDDSVTLFMGELAFANYTGQCDISTGVGQDVVTVESADTFGYSSFGWNRIDTAEGSDIVMFTGLITKHTEVSLGAGDDLLIGDPEIMSYSININANGDLGHDTVLNSSYFPFPLRLISFETIH